ncbi:hypothetical protein CGRA01v4_09490 [Colletotrichum graminicola]|uniref:Uncharacterized protein n=1 Tax=Colletotrichum graminicola (strain M1.001 / M2 / FGSC 10212) TaxID=645133 RepID=E3QVS4_COLGM|nr:uncharacterized protein GLRG_10106 [Colletotrichum graminicola M1.001]EFQ34962.1 hypothetical protein GLRG_10106 [Colletotrichum graminicola M1.001]WDK18204.1 hypothetical protein CGRA01v4_09490 [Colletotrichum graminicola]
MGDQEAAPPSPVSRISDFAFDFGLSITAFVVAAGGLFLRHDYGHGLVGLGHIVAVDRQHHHLVVACTAVRALSITLRLMKLLLAIDMPPYFVTSALPPSIEVLTASIKTARAPIGALPPDVGRQCAGVCYIQDAEVLAAGASLHLTAKSPAKGVFLRVPDRNDG